ncbi:MAG: DNA polymerase, partial [Dehalococcoidia bacterium]|nr:DNA polymerase [Dehalococcoidia bacterium]
MPAKRPGNNPANAQENSQGALLQRKPLLLLMDGHALVHRAFHAIQQPLTVRATGEEVKGVFGFMNTFLRTLADWNPTHCAIAFDMHAPTFRHIQYAEYKAQRPETAPELRAQFPHVRRLMEAFGVPIYEMEGFEADDVLGTLCRQAEALQLDTIILTGDTDTLQLVSPYVRVALQYSIQERKTYDELAVRERYGGLEPRQQPDVKALQGDPSDNIPGVRGIGAKTAIKLIQQFGSIEAVYERLDEVTPPRIQELLRQNRDNAAQGKILTTIVKEMPIKLDLDAMRFGSFDRDNVLAILRELEFTSMVNRIPAGSNPTSPSQLALLPAEAQSATAASPDSQRDYRTVDTTAALEALAEELRAAGSFAFDTETTGLDAMRCDLVGLSFSTSPGLAWYVPVGHSPVGAQHAAPLQLPIAQVLSAVRPLLEDPAIAKTAHNANYDMTVLRNQGIEVRGLAFDTMVAAHLAGQNAIGLKQLAFQLLNEQMTEISTLIGAGRKQITFDQVPIEKAAPYAAADADMTGRLRAILEPRLKEMGVQKILDEVEIPLVPVLVQMQSNGILVDPERLRRMSTDLAEQIQRLEGEIYDEAGERFNIGSPQQLGTVLFEKLLPPAKLREMELPQARRTKTGYSTDASVLEDLKGAHPVVDKVLEYRQLTKLKSTYLDTLPTLVNPRTGRVHTSYNQVGSAT